MIDDPRTRHAPASVPLLVATLALLAPAGAAAQADIMRECQADVVWEQDFEALAHPWAVLHPRASYARAMEELARTGRWDAAADQLIRSFDLLAEHATLADSARRIVRGQLEEMRADLRGRAGSAAGLANVGRFGSFLTPAAAEFTFGGNDVVLDVTRDEPVETIRAVCWTAIAAEALLSFANRNARGAVLQGLHRAVAAWDAFNSAGYAQYPWEVLINPPPDGLMPPRWQVILMHPGVALELEGVRDLRTSRRLDTILIEPVGLLWYTEARTFYLGTSLVASMPGGESPGLGPMAHIGPFLKAGYVFRFDTAAEPDRDGLVLTVDLLQLVTGAPAAYERARNQAAELLAAAVENR